MCSLLGNPVKQNVQLLQKHIRQVCLNEHNRLSAAWYQVDLRKIVSRLWWFHCQTSNDIDTFFFCEFISRRDHHCRRNAIWLNSPKAVTKQIYRQLHLGCLYFSNSKPQNSRPHIYDHVSQNKNLDTIIIMAVGIFNKDKKKRHSSSPIDLFRNQSAGQSWSIRFYYAVGGPEFLSSSFWSKMM